MKSPYRCLMLTGLIDDLISNCKMATLICAISHAYHITCTDCSSYDFHYLSLVYVPYRLIITGKNQGDYILVGVVVMSLVKTNFAYSLLVCISILANNNNNTFICCSIGYYIFYPS